MQNKGCSLLRLLLAISLGWSLMVSPSLLDIGAAVASPSPHLLAQSVPQQRGKLRVGVKDNLRPLGFRDDQGELQGLEIAIARRLALELLGDDTAVEFIPVKNQDRLKVLLNGEVDCLIANMGQNGARDRLVDFSTPYYLNSIGIVTANAQLTQRGDFRQARLGVLNNSAAIAVVKNAFPDATLVGVESYQAAQGLLATGQVDGFAGDNTVLTGWAQTDPTILHLPLFLTADPLAIALPKGLQHEDFRQQVNQALLKLKASGWLRQQWQYWGLPL
ncbi:MAG: transporter substrate-binding domain-containing protein [Synechocystis sp.]|nr:transporter substrate-binding domain-containing protein [Synechocystis sp.]